MEWWNYEVVKRKGGGVNKRYAPTQLGHLNNISITKYNIKRQIQLTMHMREEPNQKGFYMMLKCKVAWWHEHDIIMMQQLYIWSGHYITRPSSITIVRQLGCYNSPPLNKNLAPRFLGKRKQHKERRVFERRWPSRSQVDEQRNGATTTPCKTC